jgi:hypothetical protein
MKSREGLKNIKKRRTERSDTAVASAAITATFLSFLPSFSLFVPQQPPALHVVIVVREGDTAKAIRKNLFLIPKTP